MEARLGKVSTMVRSSPRSTRVSLAAAAILALSAGPASAYGVYCANGRIEIDGRSFDQMRIARGSGICMLGQFGFVSDAQSFARRNNLQPGTRCACR